MTSFVTLPESLENATIIFHISAAYPTYPSSKTKPDLMRNWYKSKRAETLWLNFIQIKSLKKRYNVHPTPKSLWICKSETMMVKTVWRLVSREVHKLGAAHCQCLSETLSSIPLASLDTSPKQSVANIHLWSLIQQLSFISLVITTTISLSLPHLYFMLHSPGCWPQAIFYSWPTALLLSSFLAYTN